jgi:hypothetical protein
MNSRARHEFEWRAGANSIAIHGTNASAWTRTLRAGCTVMQCCVLLIAAATTQVCRVHFKSDSRRFLFDYCYKLNQKLLRASIRLMFLLFFPLNEADFKAEVSGATSATPPASNEQKRGRGVSQPRHQSKCCLATATESQSHVKSAYAINRLCPSQSCTFSCIF